MCGWMEESGRNWGRRGVGRYSWNGMMKRAEKRHFYLEKMCVRNRLLVIVVHVKQLTRQAMYV
jgi:hypothetical protein